MTGVGGVGGGGVVVVVVEIESFGGFSDRTERPGEERKGREKTARIIFKLCLTSCSVRVGKLSFGGGGGEGAGVARGHGEGRTAASYCSAAVALCPSLTPVDGHRNG